MQILLITRYSDMSCFQGIYRPSFREFTQR